ncbi:MAG: DNA primase [Parcubacteria group bacterium 21-54-25]|nr:MAG: DNA primase [Parcubacteria group bacterium 21-54-25]HQU07624.1 DNA primase [Candidatus Paceibacterota bacterium]
MSDTVQRIKEQISIVDIVQPYVKLTRAGKHWKGISPFTKEKTPSFFVSPERGTYYCFSSGQGGDIFTFIEKMEGVDFKGALKILAEQAGVELQYEKGSSASRSHVERLREALARAEQFFVTTMTPEGSAYAYAKKRGLTAETITAWRLGFAPEQWRMLLEALASAGFSTKELAAAGLIKEADGKPGTWYDRFRNRLMFPIRDAAGRTVAFTGRALSADEPAKYLNSPETELFRKSEIIFGMDRAKDSIRTRGFALLVEGQMDVLHCHQAGFTNAIALSGTALSEKHLSLIKRYADNVMLVLDSDRAGLAATARAAALALAVGMRVKAVSLPENMDPADLLVQDAKSFVTRVAEAKSVIEFFLTTLSAQESDPHRLVLAVERVVIPLVAAVSSPLEREHFIGIVAHALATSPEAVRESLVRYSQRNAGVSLGVHHVSNTISEAAEPARKAADVRAEALAAVAASYPNTALAERVRNEYARIVGAPLPTPSERAVFEAELALGETPQPDVADELIHAFERAVLDEQYVSALVALRRAHTVGDREAETQAENKCAELLKRIAASL